ATTTRSVNKAYSISTPVWKRWNDYGIGLFLEGDTKDAYEAFATVDHLNEDIADGVINMARVLVNEGSAYEAIELLEDNLVRFPENKRIDFFLGKAHEALGEYNIATDYLMKVYQGSRTDFRLLLDIANTQYLSGEYEQASDFTGLALDIDPDDFGAIYQQMLVYQAQGRSDLASDWKKKYEYYKINEREEFVVA